MKKGSDPKRESPDGFDPITYQTTVPSIYAAGDVIGSPAWRPPAWSRAGWPCATPLPHYKTELPRFFRPASTRSRRSPRSAKPRKIARTGISVRRRQRPLRQSRPRPDHRRHRRDDQTDLRGTNGKLLGVHVIGEIASELVHIGMACCSEETSTSSSTRCSTTRR